MLTQRLFRCFLTFRPRTCAARSSRAATADPKLAQMRRELADGRLANSRQISAVLVARGALRADVTVERAGDLLWAFVSAELYRMLVVERGCAADDYEHWLAATLIEDLLDRSGDARDH